MKKRFMWAIHNSYANVGDYDTIYFREDEYLKAVKYLRKNARKMKRNGYPKHRRNDELILSKIKISDRSYQFFFNQEYKIIK